MPVAVDLPESLLHPYDEDQFVRIGALAEVRSRRLACETPGVNVPSRDHEMEARPSHRVTDDDEVSLDELSETVFIPAQPTPNDDSQARLELRLTTEGALALVTYTTLERLVLACGERQPWIAVGGSDLLKVAEQTGAEIVLQDIELPGEERRD